LIQLFKSLKLFTLLAAFNEPAEQAKA